MKTLDLDARMRQLVAEMSVIAEARAQRFGDGSHGGERDNSPKGARVSMAEHWHRRYNSANGPVARQEVIEAAEEDLRAVRYGQALKDRYEPGTLDWRRAIAGEPGDARDVARKFGCSVSHVYNMRKTTRRAA